MIRVVEGKAVRGRDAVYFCLLKKRARGEGGVISKQWIKYPQVGEEGYAPPLSNVRSYTASFSNLG